MERAISWGLLTMLMTIGCFWRPRPMRGVMGLFFALMGLGVHGTLIITNPEGYVAFARQAPVPFYREAAVAVVLWVTPTLFGGVMLLFETSLAMLILGRGRRVRLALLAAMAFLLAITPLGIEVAFNAVLAVGLWRLLQEDYPDSALAELVRWRAARVRTGMASGRKNRR
jgi:hypothetical protein